MSENLFNDLGNNLVIENISILTHGLCYYFRLKDSQDVYRGYYETSFNESSGKRIVFRDVEIYANNKCFKYYTKMLSTNNVDKIYYL